MFKKSFQSLDCEYLAESKLFIAATVKTGKLQKRTEQESQQREENHEESDREPVGKTLQYLTT